MEPEASFRPSWSSRLLLLVFALMMLGIFWATLYSVFVGSSSFNAESVLILGFSLLALATSLSVSTTVIRLDAMGICYATLFSRRQATYASIGKMQIYVTGSRAPGISARLYDLGGKRIMTLRSSTLTVPDLRHVIAKIREHSPQIVLDDRTGNMPTAWRWQQPTS